MAKNLVYAQSGGVTPVINASAYGVIASALNSDSIYKVYSAKNGIQGVLDEELFVMNEERKAEIEKMAYTPGGIFGSCRVKIETEEQLNRSRPGRCRLPHDNRRRNYSEPNRRR